MPAALFALAPKCFVCVAAYITAGAALRFSNAEICGGPTGATGQWMTWLPGIGLAAGAAGGIACKRFRRGKIAGAVRNPTP